VVYFVSEIRQYISLELQHRIAQSTSGWKLPRNRSTAAATISPNLDTTSAPYDGWKVGRDEFDYIRRLLFKATALLAGEKSTDQRRLNDHLLVLDLIVPLLIFAEDMEKGLPIACDIIDGAADARAAIRRDKTVVQEVVDKILCAVWPPALTLPLLSLCADLPPYYIALDDWLGIRGMVRGNLPGMPGSDYAGLLRQLLLLSESRCEVGWMGLLREVYHSMPADTIGTAELVLEQCIKQGMQSVYLILSFYERLLQGKTDEGEEMRSSCKLGVSES